MSRTHDFTETLVDWVSGQFRQARLANMWLGGGAGAHGGSSYRPVDGQITQRHVCYDTSEAASPCSPSGFSSLVDNLRRIRYWQEPATWFGLETISGLQVYIKPGLWYPSTTAFCAFEGGNSPTFTCPDALDRIDTVYIDASGILHIKQGTPDVSPTITLPTIASGIPLWAVYLTPTASGIAFATCSGYYSGMGYIERDLRPFLNLGGTAGSGVLPGYARGAILRGADVGWETYPVGATNEVLTNDGTDVLWSTGRLDLTAGKTLVVSASITLAGVDGRSLTIEGNSILNQDLTTDASVTFADIFVPDGGTFGISGNELLTVNAVGNFTFSGATSIVVPNGCWVGADANCSWVFNTTTSVVTTLDKVGIGTVTPEGMVDVAYSGVIGTMTLLLGANIASSARTNNTNKMTTVGAYHYVNAEEPVGMMYVFSSSILNRLDIGGGAVYFNAATQVSIYTAANTTTPTGTEQLKITSSFFLIDPTGAGIKVGIGLPVPTQQFHLYHDTVQVIALFESDATTLASRAWFTNQGGTLAVGQERLAGGAILTGSAGYAGVLTTTGAYPLQFGTNDAVRVTIDSAGLFGIGCIPAFTLDVQAATGGIRALSTTGTNYAAARFVNTGGILYVGIERNIGQALSIGSSAYAGVMSHSGAYSLQFGTNNTIRVTLDATGQFGVMCAPAYQLDVLENRASSFAACFFNDGDNVDRYGIIVQGGGEGADVGTTYFIYATDHSFAATGWIGTTDGVFALHDASDKNRKANIVDTKIIGLDIINGLKVCDFTWKANPKSPVMTSFVAQEVREVYPAMVGESPDGTLTTARAMLIPILTKAIQELNTRLTQMEERK